MVKRIRKLSFEERMRWGKCPECHVEDGRWCDGEIGPTLGSKIDGNYLRTSEGVHEKRLKRAPMFVKETAYEG